MPAQIRRLFLARILHPGESRLLHFTQFDSPFLHKFIGFVLNRNDFEFGLTIAALPLSILLLIQGYLAAKYEKRWMMWSFLAGLVAGFAYFSYKVSEEHFFLALCSQFAAVQIARYNHCPAQGT